MAESNYAFVKDGIVTNIAVFNDPDQELLNQFKEVCNVDDIVFCGDNSKAAIGVVYSNGKFILQKPYSSWILDENDDWQAPTPMPTEGFWTWDESTTSWVEVVE